jgi:hypothetical protein
LHSSQQNTPKHPSTSGTRQAKQTYTSCMAHLADSNNSRSPIAYRNRTLISNEV